MKAQAVRLHGAGDLRLDTFELPEIGDDEILVKVISDSVCMSTYKCAILGTEHKRVHPDVAEHPAIMGHEFAGIIEKVGKNHQDKFKPGMRFAQQPALNYKGTMWSPGYSYEFFGGDATYCIIPAEVMELNCLMEYTGKAFFEASLAEPMSCCIGAFHACYHTKMGDYHHEMGIKEGGSLALLAGVGPMGLGALAYALCCDRRPGNIVVTDINDERLQRAHRLFDHKAKEAGIRLDIVNTKDLPDAAATLKELNGGKGFDDVFCFAPVGAVLAMAAAGADLVELGIPFSDPTAEGPVIQEANLRALTAGTTTDKVFDLVRDLRQDVTIPFVFMTYANVVFSYGAERFLSTCAEIGVDGLILPDLPFEEKEEFLPLCRQCGVNLISMIAPTSENRIAMIAKEAEGFLYVVSSLGVTGTRSEIKTDLASIVDVVRRNTAIPCAIGFGISTPEQAHRMASIADGAIVGSAIVKQMAQYGKEAPAHVGEFVRRMKQAL